MPEVFLNKANREDYFYSYLDTYIDKDIKNSIQSKNSMLFRNFLKFIALRTSQELNKTTISNSLGISVKTVDERLNILELSGIIFFLRPYMANISKRIIKTPKIYFYDTGLCSYLCGWNDPNILKESAMSGAFYENYVISEIIKSMKGDGIRWEDKLFYYRDIDQKEIDLLYVNDNEITPIEIKKSVFPIKPNKNFSVLKKYNMIIKPGLIIDSASKITPINENVYIYPLHLIGA